MVKKGLLKKQQRKKIIISADDFGISSVANNNILELVKAGKIDRVAVMISENLSPQEIKELKQSGVRIDIHLHLVKYDSDYWRGNRRMHEGAVKRLIMFIGNYLTGNTSPDKVELQWAIQIEKFRQLFGRNPDGIGSHEYIHFFSPYFRVVLKLSEKYHIPFIRLGTQDYLSDNSVAKVLNWLRSKNITQLQAHRGSRSSDYLVSLDWLASEVAVLAERLPENTLTELVCHPERDDEYKVMLDL